MYRCIFSSQLGQSKCCCRMRHFNLKKHQNKSAQSNLGTGPCHSAKSPLLTMAHSKFVSKITPFRGPIPKPNYLSHLGTRPSDLPSQTATVGLSVQPFCHNALDRQTHTGTHTETNRWLAGMFDDYRPLTLYRERNRHGLKR